MTSNQLKDFAAYLLSPSEIECRTVAARLTWTPEQRRARPPVAALHEEEASTKRFLECLEEFLRQSEGRENLTVNDVKTWRHHISREGDSDSGDTVSQH